MKAARVSRPCPRHRGKLLALLAATAALAGGAQALVPAPAAAVVNQGEECDPNLPSSDCEPNNGGGGDGSGGAGQSGDGGPIVGEETIEVSGELPPLRPSPCTQSSCLAHQLGGGPQVAQADRGPRLPRRGGRPGRLAKPSPVDWRASCKGAIDTANAAQVELNHFLWYEFKGMSVGQRVRQRAWRNAVHQLRSRRTQLREWLPALRATQGAGAQVDEMESVLLALEVELVESSEAMDTASVQVAHIYSRLNALERDALAATERELECKYQREKPSRDQLPPSDGDR